MKVSVELIRKVATVMAKSIGQEEFPSYAQEKMAKAAIEQILKELKKQ